MQQKKRTIVNFSPRFLQLCESSGVTQKELAQSLGLSEGALINYKRDRVPKAEELLRIADYFGVSFEWLLTGEDSRPHSASSAIWRERAIHAEKRLQDVKEILQTAIKKI